jgi:hypothetical protein
MRVSGGLGRRRGWVHGHVLPVGVGGFGPVPDPEDPNRHDVARPEIGVPDPDLPRGVPDVLALHREDGADGGEVGRGVAGRVDLEQVPEAAAVAADVLLAPLLPGVAEQRDVGEDVQADAPDVARLPPAVEPDRRAVQRERLPLHGRLPVLGGGEPHRPVGAVGGGRELEPEARERGADRGADEGRRARLARRALRGDVGVGEAPGEVEHLRARRGEVHHGGLRAAGAALPLRGHAVAGMGRLPCTNLSTKSGRPGTSTSSSGREVGWALPEPDCILRWSSTPTANGCVLGSRR